MRGERKQVVTVGCSRHNVVEELKHCVSTPVLRASVSVVHWSPERALTDFHASYWRLEILSQIELLGWLHRLCAANGLSVSQCSDTCLQDADEMIPQQRAASDVTS